MLYLPSRGCKGLLADFREGDEADAVGLLTQERLADWLPQNRDIDVYFLGPKAFMTQVKSSLAALGVPGEQCKYEFLGPASALAA